MGAVVDPSARDDGGSEPELLLDDGPGSGPRGTAEHPLGGDGRGAVTGGAGTHPVRARLLSRAAAVRRGASADDLPPTPTARALDEVGRLPTLELELERELDLLPRRPPSAPTGRPRAQLSPNAIALIGAVFGLATLAVIVAVMMRLAPRRHGESDAALQAPQQPGDTAQTPAAPKKRIRAKVPGPWRIVDAAGDPALKKFEGSIGHESFLKAITAAGLKESEAYRALTVLKELRDLDKCRATDRFLALVDRGSSRLKAFEYVVSPEDVYQAREGAGGLLAAKKLDLRVERARVQAAIQITGRDFDAAAEAAGLEKGLAKIVARALDGHVALEELGRGDLVRIVVQEVTVLGDFARYAGVEALEYRPAGTGADQKPLRVYYWKGPASRGYFDASGRSPNEGGWRKPIKDAPITSHFNPKRMHPVLKKIMPHTGTDFGASAGTPVGASSYGTVSFVGNSGPSGNLVKIDHPGGVETGYAHLSKFADGLKPGIHVKRMQVVGYVGSTGRSTGPHLHFSARRDGQFFDAETLNLDGMKVLPKDERDLFAAHIAQYDALLDALPLPAALPSEPAPVAAAPTEPDEEAVDPEFGVAPAAMSVPPAAAPAGSAAPAAAAPAGSNAAPKNAVWITDKDLLQQQPASDDGEVEE